VIQQRPIRAPLLFNNEHPAGFTGRPRSARWAQAADGFLTLFGTKLIPGVADQRTLESISTALGEYDRKMVSTARPIGRRAAPHEWIVASLGRASNPWRACSNRAKNCDA
jgi:hypothetical protein